MSNRFTWNEGDMEHVTRFTPADHEYHANHGPDDVFDDCPLCWVGMTPEKFARHHLDGVSKVTALAADDMSFLVGVEFEDGRSLRAIVYPPTGDAETWDLEIEDEPPSLEGALRDAIDENDYPGLFPQDDKDREATTWRPAGDAGCIDPPTAEGDE